MGKKKNAVMLADTRPTLIGIVLEQLEKTNKGLFDEAIIYYTIDISDVDKELMNKMIPCRFIKYKCPIPEKIFEKPRFKLFSPLMFVRYEMPAYLNEFETITWIDTDILIQGDISGMIAAAKKTGAAFIREDPINKTAEKSDKMRSCFSSPVNGFDLNKYLYCSGTIVLTEKCTQSLNKLSNWCYQKTIEWSDVLDLPDQGVLNAAIQQFDISVTPLSGKEYCCYPYLNRDCKEAKIIHAWGLNKFWNDWYIYQNYPEWRMMYEKWVMAGGSKMAFDIKPEISVVIPSYKPNLDLFKQCLDSLMAQNRNNWERYSNFEIIIVAEPFEQQKIEEFVNSYNDKRVRIIFNDERKGIAASLNIGIRAAKGRYIARIDDDDIAARERLYLQKEYLNAHPEISLCTTDFEYFGDMNEQRLSFEGEVARAWSIFTCPFDHPTIMFRKDFFEKNNLYYDENRGFVEDWELWQRAFEKGMTVGCIHQNLFYHRWINNSSAGQSNKTIDMMREMIKDNFEKLNVVIPEEDLKYIGPWNGQVFDESVILRVSKYFSQAIENNKTLKLYDDKSLQYVLQLRIEEMRTGILPGLVKGKEDNIEHIMEATVQKKNGGIKLAIKRLFQPLYRPIKNRYEERIAFTMEKVLAVEGHVMNCIHKLDAQQDILKTINSKIDYIEEINSRISCLEEQMDNMDKQLEEQMDNINRLLEVEKNHSEMLNSTYGLSNYIISLLNSQANLLNESNEARKEENNQTQRHLDFLYRDIMVVLEKCNGFIKKENVELITDYSIAYQSYDYLVPHGTIRDNTRFPRFVEKCEKLLKEKELSFLDLGCSGGGMVLEAALKGHFSMGLEGSDISKIQQRAEWRLLGENLQTCDITKPFQILDVESNSTYKFNVISAWEVLEHIAESDLPQLFRNIKSHLSTEGRFVASIANYDDIDPDTGVNWHVTLHDNAWWKNRIESFGFEICENEFSAYDMARGSYNPPHCYEKLYEKYDSKKTFFVIAKKK